MADEPWTLAEIVRTIYRIEKAIEDHEKSHAKINLALVVVFLTAVLNLSGVALASILHH